MSQYYMKRDHSSSMMLASSMYSKRMNQAAMAGKGGQGGQRDAAGNVLACSVKRGGKISGISGASVKRAYMADFETFPAYFRPYNLAYKALLVGMVPCVDALSDITKHLTELEDQQRKTGKCPDGEIPSFESEWAKRESKVLENIYHGAFKVFSIDMIRKAFEHYARDNYPTRIVDRLTKSVEKSALRKLERFGRGWMVDRPFVCVKLMKTSMWALALGRTAAFVQEILARNWTFYRKHGLGKYFNLSGKEVRRTLEWTIRRVAFYSIQWGCHIVCMSIGSAFDTGWFGKNFGSALGFTAGELMADEIAKVLGLEHEGLIIFDW